MTMTWTTSAKLTLLMWAPWTIDREESPDDPGDIILRVRELPGTIAIGTPEELDTAFWDALRASLSARLEFGDPIPRPVRLRGAYPWDRPSPAEGPTVAASGDLFEIDRDPVRSLALA
jgi:hypothetical protein